MEFFDVVHRRRSIRKFDSRSVEQEKIDHIIDAALRAPSGRNSRSTEIIVVSDPQVLSLLSSAKPGGAAFLKEAPLAMVVFGDPQKSPLYVENAAIFAAYIQLAARAQGLDSCWSHMRGNAHSEKQSSTAYIAGLLNAPSHLEAECIIAIGYSDEAKEPYAKDELPMQCVHLHQY
jgi:nitroreductase